MTPTGGRAAGYVRVSSRRQAEQGFSLEDQKAKLTELAERNGWTLDLFEDAGISGETLDRPAMLALLQGVDQGKFDLLLVVDESRLARDEHIGSIIRDRLRRKGVRLVTSAGIKDLNDPSDSFTAGILNLASAFEQRLRTVKTTAGVKEAARRGYWTGGPPPFGFMTVPADGKHKKLALNENEAGVLRLATSYILDERNSTHEAAEKLNALGPAYQPRQSSRWVHRNLRRMLLEAPLSGRWVYGRPRWGKGGTDAIACTIEQIIPHERHQRLLKALEETSVPHYVSRRLYVLRGRLKAQCGGNYQGTARNDRDHGWSYKCANSAWGATERCECPRVPTDLVEDMVWRSITDLLGQPERLQRMAEDYLAIRVEQADSDREQAALLDRRISKLERALKRAYMSGLLAEGDAAVAADTIKDLESDLAVARGQRTKLNVWSGTAATEADRMARLKTLAMLARGRLVEMSKEDRFRVVSLLDIRVTVVGGATCLACQGRRKVKGGRGGVRCKPCAGTGHIPSLMIEGTVWDWLPAAIQSGSGRSVTDETETPRVKRDNGVPFRLEVPAVA